jgi:CO/xanthine dehydrogenase Mo-binding subunit
MSDFSIIGKRVALVDSAGKTTGQGKYTDEQDTAFSISARADQKD